MDAITPPGPDHLPASSGRPAADHGSRVHIVRHGGLMQALGLVIGLFMFGCVFLAGLGIGAVFTAGALFEEGVARQVYREGGDDTIAIVPVSGIIDGYQSETVRMLVDEALADPSVKACVLRVDSPGGAIAPSDQIWSYVNRMRGGGLPVVASFGGLAASGGYYVSCATDHIMAEPTTITGSIGVIAQTFVIKNLLDKVGIEPVTLLATDSPQKDLGSPFREWSEADRSRYTALLDAAYDIFYDRVRTGRGHVITDPLMIEELADGSIYTAEQALDSGLVDSIGYLDDAVAQAERLAGLVRGRSSVVILYVPEPVFGPAIGAAARDRLDRIDADRVRAFVNELGMPRLMYLMR